MCLTIWLDQLHCTAVTTDLFFQWQECNSRTFLISESPLRADNCIPVTGVIRFEKHEVSVDGFLVARGPIHLADYLHLHGHSINKVIGKYSILKENEVCVWKYKQCRYPSGESYRDVIARLDTVVTELERGRDCVLVVAHQAILRALYGYFTDMPLAVSIALSLWLLFMIIIYYCYLVRSAWNRSLRQQKQLSVPGSIAYLRTWHISLTMHYEADVCFFLQFLMVYVSSVALIEL